MIRKKKSGKSTAGYATGDGGDILDNAEAQEIIAELYDIGHNLADFTIAQVLGNQLSREEREDLVQEGFLRLVSHVDALKKRTLGERMSYLQSTMRNLAIDEGRKRTQRRMLGYLDILDSEECMEFVSHSPTPEEQWLLDEEIRARSRRLQAALERLEERDLALLTEKYGNQLSDKAIGEKLGIKSRNVASYLSRARKRVAGYYAEEIQKEQKERKNK